MNMNMPSSKSLERSSFEYSIILDDVPTTTTSCKTFRPSPGNHVPCFCRPWRKGSSRRWKYLSLKPSQVGWSLAVILLFICLGTIIWLSFIVIVTARLRLPIAPSNGIQKLLRTWQEPTVTSKSFPTWEKDFTRGVVPIPCHSHNDYFHRIPLYEALAAGCTGVEADIWLGTNPNGEPELFVGHKSKHLSQSRTLRSLYLDPLMDILTQQNNVANTFIDSKQTNRGVFHTSPDTTLVLLIDFKAGGDTTWPVLLSQLEPLRSRGWLSFWTPEASMEVRPITIVATGNAPFDLVRANSSYRQVFYDAPIDKLEGEVYNSNNSYYASAKLSTALGGHTFSSSLGEEERSRVSSQVEQANALGLRSRYWGTPTWPTSWRNRMWDQLVGLGVSVLNVDDLIAATHWDWNMCIIGGIVMCG